ncbi:MAG TPA: slipin family protein [Herpetosiphonaceae bacterium]
MGGGVVVFFVVLLVIFLISAIKIIPEYEKGVIFRLGRLAGARGPGMFFVIPMLERMFRVDTRVITMDVPAQEVITRDNVTIRVNAVLYFRVLDPARAVTTVMDYIRATMQIAQTTLRSVVGQVELDELLAQRDQINHKLQQIIDDQTEPWGIKVTIVELKDVELPQSMQRAMARQAEAEREKRAKIIHADGEFQASKMLAEAADVIAQEPVTLQLRYLQTLTEIAVEKNSTLIFPFPIDLVRPFLEMTGMNSAGSAHRPAPPTRPAPAPAPAPSHHDTPAPGLQQLGHTDQPRQQGLPQFAPGQTDQPRQQGQQAQPHPQQRPKFDPLTGRPVGE